MSGFMSFGSFEEALEFMARATEDANAHLVDEQKALTWDSYWFRPYEDIVIFGHVFGEEEFRDREFNSYHRGGPLSPEEEEEFAFSVQSVKENHERGYLFGEAWSVWEPRGELGDVHRASAWPITKEQFLIAQREQWNHKHPNVRAWLEPLWRSINERRPRG